MSEAQKAALEAVAIDLWDAYINRVRHPCPKALIVFELFHVVKTDSRVIDEVRRAETRRAAGPMRQVVKGSRYWLLMNRENLRPDQADRLDELLKLNANLNAVYALKDQLKMIYHYRRHAQAKAALDQWCAMAGRVDNPWMTQFIKTLRH